VAEVEEQYDLEKDIQTLLKLMRKTQLHVMQPAYIEPPFRAKGIDDFGTITATAGSAFTQIVAFTVPRNFFGVIRGWGQDLDDLTGFDGDTTWRIVVNGAAVRPYDLVTRQIGTVIHPRDCMIPVQAGEVVELQVANAGAGDYEATGFLKGWYWPAKLTGSTGGFADTLTD
jgi:hypothetical protein